MSACSFGISVDVAFGLPAFPPPLPKLLSPPSLPDLGFKVKVGISIDVAFGLPAFPPPLPKLLSPPSLSCPLD